MERKTKRIEIKRAKGVNKNINSLVGLNKCPIIPTV
jgi:hypothetical protein